MIELQKVKRDVINYGALKVYTTFLTISEEEVDPELFAASQLVEIFAKKYDVLKVNISFVEGEPAEVVGTELLVFKLSKCSDNEISYMSNVDDEGKLSSLVLTKSGDEVSLEVVEYSIGGETPSGGSKLYLHEVVVHEQSAEGECQLRASIIDSDNTQKTGILSTDHIVGLVFSVLDMTTELFGSVDISLLVCQAGKAKLCEMIHSTDTLVSMPESNNAVPMIIYNGSNFTKINYHNMQDTVRTGEDYHKTVTDTVTEL